MCSEHVAVALGLALLSILSSACSVKEDRTPCPCTFRIDLSRVDAGILLAHGYDRLHVGVGGIPDTTVSIEGMPAELVYDVPRGALQSFVLAAPDTCVGVDGSVRVPPGSQFPEVYAHYMHGRISLALTDVVRLRKSYCLLEMLVTEAEPYRASLTVSGAVVGYDGGGGLLDGTFSVRVVPDGDGRCSVRIPRQADGSLRLTMDYGDSERRTFAIGEYILSSGYDWAAEDMEDISIKVSLSRAYLSFSTELFGETVGIEVTV